jgi:hypothetical protein
MNLRQPDIHAGSVFSHDEPVVQSHPLLVDARVPCFGDTDLWNLNGVIRRPARHPPAVWMLVFSQELSAPAWNLLARELSMALLNPRHPALIAAGLSFKPTPAHPSTVIAALSNLRRLARWAAGEDLRPQVRTWQESDVRRFIQNLRENLSASSITHYVTLLKSLHRYGPVLSDGGLRSAPWPGRSAREVSRAPARSTVSTPTIGPDLWFPLIRAAWTYVHTFAPDVLRAGRRHQELLANTAADVGDASPDEQLRGWLNSPGHRIPIHATAPPGKADACGEVNWSLLTILLTGRTSAQSSIFTPRSIDGRRRMTQINEAIAAGHPTTTGVIDDLAQVSRTDGTTGPWHPGLSPSAIKLERVALRNACYVLVVGLSMMRDSEIHEIGPGSLVEHYGTPAIVSTKHKHDANLPSKHWWITNPVAEAIVVAEQLSGDPERIFSPVRSNAYVPRSHQMLDTFVAHVNATRAATGLDEIPTGRARAHMFRRTMAMLTDQFAGSEIAVGIQLKHVATRALANTSTQGYVAADTAWADHLESAIEAARFRRLEDLYQTHKSGEPLGYGPAAERIAEVFNDIQDTTKARRGDATVERALLLKARISLRFGTLNHCAFDETNPASAACLENAIQPPGTKGPLIDRCRPDRCANSVIAPAHLPIWDSQQRTLLTLIDTPGLPAARKECLRRELTQVNAVLRKADKEDP